MNNLVKAKRLCLFIGCTILIKQDVKSMASTIMLLNGMYVDRSEPIGNMPVLLHLLQQVRLVITKLYGKIEVN